MKVDVLRLQLPPWQEAEAARACLRCGYRLPDGSWHDGGELALHDVARMFHAKRIEACLHPAEVPMAAFTLPPLTGRRLHAAVQGAIEPCALQLLEQLVTGFGPRTADGTVTAAWIARSAASDWHALLRRHGVAVRELHLPAAFLACAPQGGTACRIDQWLVVRSGLHHGFAQWLPEGTQPPLDAQWTEVDADPTGRWSGEGWRWSLPAGEAAAGGARAVPVTALAGWGVLAAAVWLAGLTVHGHQLAAQGQALKRQMAARVQAAFLDVLVVVDPVRQAKQQKEALAAGAAPAAAGDAAGLLRAGAGLLAQMPAGQVQGLRYTAGALQLRWRDGGAPSADERRVLQARAAEQGLSAQADAQGLRVTLAATAAGGTASESPASAPGPDRRAALRPGRRRARDASPAAPASRGARGAADR
ncbi:type II secretion system protein GspL [Variovorax sp. RCC_210]|uniref:type II secretion system protein GspL n=1 Tax=Variovorax sp. RCC_210 TaxID=3239217 RepID=UPI003523154B